MVCIVTNKIIFPRRFAAVRKIKERLANAMETPLGLTGVNLTKATRLVNQESQVGLRTSPAFVV